MEECSSCSYLEDLADSLIQHLPVYLPAHLGPPQEKLLLLEVLGSKAEVCSAAAPHPAPRGILCPQTAHTYPLDDVLGWHAHHNPQHQLILLGASADSIHGGHVWGWSSEAVLARAEPPGLAVPSWGTPCCG